MKPSGELAVPVVLVVAAVEAAMAAMAGFVAVATEEWGVKVALVAVVGRAARKGLDMEQQAREATATAGPAGLGQYLFSSQWS